MNLWGKNTRLVTEVAYNNTVREESALHIEQMMDIGLRLKSGSRFETVGHLLYWLPNLVSIIERRAPHLHNQPLLLNVPSWDEILLLRTRDYPFISQYHQDNFQDSLLSKEVYILAGEVLTAKAVGIADGQLRTVELGAWGLGAGEYSALPYCP